MTIVNKPKSSKSKKSPSSRRSDKSKKPRTKKMASRTANLGRVPPAEDPKQVSVDKGPGGALYCRSSQKSKPFAPRDLVVNDGIAPPQRILFPPEKICMDWQQTQSVGVGLQNLGNTCFLNSTLQCLTYTPPLANYMLSLEHTQSCEYFLPSRSICRTALKVKVFPSVDDSMMVRAGGSEQPIKCIC